MEANSHLLIIIPNCKYPQVFQQMNEFFKMRYINIMKYFKATPNKWTIDTHNNSNKSQIHLDKWKKPDLKCCIVYDSISLWKRENYKEGKCIIGGQFQDWNKGCWHRDHIRKFWGPDGMFCILIMTIVAQVYALVMIHKTAHIFIVHKYKNIKWVGSKKV